MKAKLFIICKNQLDEYISKGWIKGYILKWENYKPNGKLKNNNFITISNFQTKTRKRILTKNLQKYIADGWIIGKITNFDLYNSSGEIIDNRYKFKMNLKTDYKNLNDFFLSSSINEKIYELFLQGKSNRIISDEIKVISSVSVGKRINIIKTLI